MSSASQWCSRIIAFCFYALFFAVPLFFTNSTSELFELNKMWLTFWLTIAITASWLIKSCIDRQLKIQRTPFDIPLLLFLLSQIISTVLSMDQHVSFWGYYSRFNGGLLSTICYIILYYAFVTFMTQRRTFITLGVSLVAGSITALWGLPSHFGADPTCYIFRGSFDVSCWTDSFRPTIRIFSTLGQPAWMAAYLTLLLPISFAFFLNIMRHKLSTAPKYPILAVTLFLLSALFYLDLIFTNTRAGVIAFWIANILFWAILFLRKIISRKKFWQYAALLNIAFVILSFFFGWGFNFKYLPTFSSLQSALTSASKSTTATTTQPTAQTTATDLGDGATDSGKIRLYVWQGALDIWKSSPLFGTGVETYAFAYYRFKPVGHNLTSEWDYLYNKAHNEYLNYLATTGIFGLGTYLAFVGFFLWKGFVWFFLRKESEPQTTQPVYFTQTQKGLLIVGIFTGFISILITNFFGFSVVIMNLYLFLIPGFFLIISETLPKQQKVLFPAERPAPRESLSPYQWTGILLTSFIALFFAYKLYIFWAADKEYALGHNFSQINDYGQAYPHLLQAVQDRGSEPVFKDELAIASAAMGAAYLSQKDATNAAQFVQQATALSDEVVTDSPNNIVFWKDRVRMFYILGQVNPAYLEQALQAMQKAKELAPNDAKVSYNLGVLYGQTGDSQKGIDELNRTIQLKPDYRDAYFALALFYRDLATKDGKVVNADLNQKAIDKLHFILDNFKPVDKQVTDTLKSWNAS